jgi:hypothetical protein
LSADAQSKSYKNVMVEIMGLDTKHIVHESRPSSANLLKMYGISYDAIHNAGRWAGMTVCQRDYLDQVEPSVIMAHAGFDFRRRDYLILRDLAKPPAELTDLIFPFLKQYKGMDFKGKVRQHLCTAATIEVFEWLAEVIYNHIKYFRC